MMAAKNFPTGKEYSFSKLPEILPEREPTIIEKLHKLAKEVSLSGSNDVDKENQDNQNRFLENVIPKLLEQEHHNYIVIDSFNVILKTEKGSEAIMSFKNASNEIDKESYKKWFDHLKNRLWPSDVSDILLEFSVLSAKLCYDGYTIVELKNIKDTDDRECFNYIINSLNECDVNSKIQINSKFLLVKVQSEDEKQHNYPAVHAHTFPGQFCCLDPILPDIHIESMFDKETFTGSPNNKSAQDIQPEKIKCSEKSPKNVDTYSPCRMSTFLAARHFLRKKKNKFSVMGPNETFHFQYFCGSENQTIVFNKGLSITKAVGGNFSLTQYEEYPFCSNEFIEVEEERDVNKMIHSVYHNCLKECSSKITVSHKFSDEEQLEKIFEITFKKNAKQRKETPEVSLIKVSYLEVPETSLVSGKFNKPRFSLLDNVHGWFEAKEKYKIELKSGLKHMLKDDFKGTNHILLDYNYEGIINELKRLKRMCEEHKEDSTSVHSSDKRIRTEKTDLMEVEENSSSDKNGSKCGASGQNNFQDDMNCIDLPENGGCGASGQNNFQDDMNCIDLPENGVFYDLRFDVDPIDFPTNPGNDV